MNTLGGRLKAARELRQLSQAELARRAHVSQPTITQIENHQTLESKKIANLAEALEVSPNWLVNGKGEMEGNGTQQYPDPEDYTEEEREVILLFREMLPKQRKDVFQSMQEHIAEKEALMAELMPNHDLDRNISKQTKQA